MKKALISDQIYNVYSNVLRDVILSINYMNMRYDVKLLQFQSQIIELSMKIYNENLIIYN